MFNEVPKKLIIVGNKHTDVYCEYLSMLISTEDDIKGDNSEETIVRGIKDGSVDTAIWTDDIYRDNRAHTSSRQKILFIGDDGCAEKIIKNIAFHDDDATRLGIYYGWLGNKAVIYIDDTLYKNSDLYKEFIPKYDELSNIYNKKIEAVAQKKGLLPAKATTVGVGATIGATAMAATFLPGLLLTTTTIGLVKNAKDNHETKETIRDQAYRYAILNFYLNYLSSFMG